jgi:signal transduction histidine kinase
MLVATLVVISLGVAARYGFTYAQRRAARLPYHDRFATEGLKGWQNLGGAWFAGAGTVMNDSEERGAKLLFGSDTWSDYSLSADVQVLGPDGDAGVILRSTDEQLGTNAYSGYYAGLRTHDGRLVLGRANYGWLESQTTTFPTGIKMQHWYHLQVAAVGCTVAAVATDLASGVRSTVSMQGQPCVHQGRIGLRSYSTGARWRNLLVAPADVSTLASLHATPQPKEQPGIYSLLLNHATDLQAARGAEIAPGTIAPLPHASQLLRSIGSLRYASSIDPKPISIRGTVVLRRPMLFVQDATGGIAIPGQDPLRFAAGDAIEATGIPALGTFSLQLLGAKVVVLGPGKPLPPKSVTASEAATGIYDAQYIEVTGFVTENESKQTPPDLVIASGSQTFRGLLPASANGEGSVHLPRNALVRVRGVEAVDPGLTHNQTPFILFLPSSDSVELLADPPWWSLENMIWIVPIFVIVLLLAQLLRVRVRHMRVQAAMEERQRLGREIHDTLAQSFAGVGYQLQAVRSSLAVGSSAVSEHVDLAIEMVRHSHQEARRSIAAMQPELLEGTQLAAMLEERARHMVKGTPLRIIATTNGEARQPSPRVIDALFRIGQEAIANAVCHASPATLRILVVFHSRAVQLVIEDDGVGFDPAADLPGLGLRSMRKRAEAVGAELLVTSRPGCGARVELRASLRRQPEIGRQFGKRRVGHAREN